jgi:hypothetical protein
MRSWLCVGGLAIALCMVATSSPSFGAGMATANDRAWAQWRLDLQKTCPTRHADWLYEAAYPYLYGAFNARISSARLRKVERVADIQANCTEETVGHSCELGNYLRAYDTLGLMGPFTRFSCHVVKCKEGALCSRAPGQN